MKFYQCKNYLLLNISPRTKHIFKYNLKRVRTTISEKVARPISVSGVSSIRWVSLCLCSQAILLAPSPMPLLYDVFPLCAVVSVGLKLIIAILLNRTLLTFHLNPWCKRGRCSDSGRNYVIRSQKALHI